MAELDISKLDNLNGILEEIQYLKKSHELLNKIESFLTPYIHEINGQDCGDLPRQIAEHLYGFDDSE